MNIQNITKAIRLLFLLLSSAFLFMAIIKHIKNRSSIVIGFGGDTMLGRLVNQTIDQIVTQDRYRYSWGNLLTELHSTDFNFVNLETTLTQSSKIIPKVFNFKATPDKVESLKQGKIEAVNLANNHILDFSVEGLLETLKTLDHAGILHTGAGTTIDQAKKPIIIEKNNVRIGIIGYTDNEPTWLATRDTPGTNYVKVGDIETIKSDIKDLRNQVDILILSIHWGPNMRQLPTQEFVDFAHEIIDTGIDIFHGHSAHIFQGIEIYKNKIIFYDTGDFVDDYAVDQLLRNDQSFFYKVFIENKKLHKIQLIPTIISNMQVNKAEGQEKAAIIKKMQELSAEFGTQIHDDGMVNL